MVTAKTEQKRHQEVTPVKEPNRGLDPDSLPMEVLLVEDEDSIRITLADDLEAAGFRVVAVKDGNEAKALLETRVFDVMISDMRLPGKGGMDLLHLSRQVRPATAVILITGYGTIETAVEALRAGAYHYVLKPFLNEEMVEHVSRIARIKQLERDNVKLKEKLGRFEGFETIIGQSRVMREVVTTVKRVAQSDASVLIQGESGTGKEVIARAIHDHSPRAAGEFMPLSCASLPETLIEAELFGHEKGAFTDAKKGRKGRFELAHGGTLFLDDVDDLELTAQVKLLRAIEERTIERVGGESRIKVDIRLVTATKKDLGELVANGEFREDLFYRLNVVTVKLPPLRDRPEDVPLLVEHFIRRLGGGRPYEIKPEIMDELMKYGWPGNVRELVHAVERAIALAGEARFLKKDHLLPPSGEFRSASQISGRVATLKEAVEDAEIGHLRKVLKLTRGHRAQAAKLLGISRKNLWEKLRDYDLDL